MEQVATLTRNNAPILERPCRQQSQTWEHLNVVALKKTYYQSRTSSAVCVQHSIDSRNSAIHSAYRTLLRPSSLPEPRDPSLKVVKTEVIYNNKKIPGSLEIGYLLVAALPNEGSDSHLRVNPPPFPEASCAHSKIQV